MPSKFYRIFWSFLIGILLSGIVHAQHCNLSDEFEGSTLNPAWSHYQSSLYTSQVAGGTLIMNIDPMACSNNCPWFHAQSAGFIYKMVEGDFDVTTLVQAVQATGEHAGEDIDNDTQLAGLMARDGSAASENYVFNVAGTRFDIASVETKSTTNDNSGTIEHFVIGSTRTELRMTREGDTFTMYSRDIGATTWILRSIFVRSDLPSTLQVGVIAYAFESYPVNLSAQFDYVRFAGGNTINAWLGGNGLWSTSSKWSLNQVPDSSHHVIIDNTQAQIIEILSEDNFKCATLDIQGAQTELLVDGVLEVKGQVSGCDE